MKKRLLTLATILLLASGCSNVENSNDTVASEELNYKVKTFASPSSKELEKQINEWLAEGHKVIDIYYSTSRDKTVLANYTNYSALIYYISDEVEEPEEPEEPITELSDD